MQENTSGQHKKNLGQFFTTKCKQILEQNIILLNAIDTKHGKKNLSARHQKYRNIGTNRQRKLSKFGSLDFSSTNRNQQAIAVN